MTRDEKNIIIYCLTEKYHDCGSKANALIGSIEINANQDKIDLFNYMQKIEKILDQLNNTNYIYTTTEF
jgi:hypothetical protein